LLATVRQIANDSGIHIETESVGEATPLPEIIEENLLRIGQEAVTNVVKHSGAKLVKIKFEFSAEKVVLQIKDNGNGFNPEACLGPKDGHFGLLGIRERTERMGGKVFITSSAEAGTVVGVEIPGNFSKSHQPSPVKSEYRETSN